MENISQNGCIYWSFSFIEYDTVKWRSENIMKELKGKIEDYTRFGQILLAVSTLLMVGLLIPNGAKETIQFFVMMGSIVIFLSLSFFFFQRVRVMRDQLEENECE
ncbi:hypothetical Membrane Spanning Protein [Bacillus cereus ATCC 14579]|uniref:Hypothetical Membrane Spanning Protein n=2 Tax=Bacillaceae TaxID=186817 RepID=Q812S2_BACCR|nr:hypothetical Membrane Spanning Protein [Bacillus cereus ATCC 14579]OOR42794.1 hypothetical protein BW895_01145 [Bacillus cereus]OOR44442.1 hypothetical protein BW896_19265 [Bacillus cereus]